MGLDPVHEIAETVDPGAACRVRALIRWKSPTGRGPVPPVRGPLLDRGDPIPVNKPLSSRGPRGTGGDVPMAKFPSHEWIALFQEELNKNAAYEDSARTWEGDFIFVVEPDGPMASRQAFYLDLFHGKCREARLLTNPEERSAAYSYAGTYSNWKRLIQGELDPLKALMGGQFKLKGNMMKIMRYTRAAKELVNTASRVPTEFQ